MQPKEPENKTVETASATSASGQHAGSFAYVLTGVVIGLLVLFSLGMGSCTAFFLHMALEDETVHQLIEESQPYLDDPDAFEQWLQRQQDGSDNGAAAETTSVDQALDYSLAAYEPGLKDRVTASSYAGTPDEARGFVRELVVADQEYTAQLVAQLDAAALNEQDRADHLRQARTLCDTAKGALDNIALPSMPGENGGEVKDRLGEARAKAQDRWDALGEEMDVLLSGDTVDTARLWSADDAALQATEEASEALMEAMAFAAEHK